MSVLITLKKQLNNESFLEWLSTKQEIRPSKFKKYVAK